METVLKISKEEALKKFMGFYGKFKHLNTSDEELDRIKEESYKEFIKEKGWD